jgi:secreted trypsin-like serine protease
MTARMLRSLLFFTCYAGLGGLGLVACSADARTDDGRSAEEPVVGGRLETRYPAVGYLASGATPDEVTSLGCGATLIAPDVVVTAAHCIVDKLPRGARAFGFGVGDASAKKITVAKRVYVHPAYAPWLLRPTARGDIAILQLERPILDVAPMRVVTPSAAGSFLYLGYGRTTPGGVSVTDGYTLERKSMPMEIVRFDDVDVQAHGVGGGNCWGDSGGPLFDPERGLIGVISKFAGANDCQVGNDMLFANLSSEMGFVEAATKCQLGDPIDLLPLGCPYVGGSPPAEPPTMPEEPPEEPPADANGCRDVCQPGAAMPETCDPCVKAVCAHDAFCCSYRWDVGCIADMKNVCPSAPRCE